MANRRAGTSWKNWTGNQACAPGSIDRPRTEGEVGAIVRQAAEAGQRVKVFGAGHSFTAIALTDGRLLSLDDYGEILHVDKATGRVTAQAGVRLQKLNQELWARGLALPNLGDIAHQSIAGAISTSTHGTGATFGGIAAQVVAMRIIAGDGERDRVRRRP